MSWTRKRAVDVHDETAPYFSNEYSSDNIYDSPFRYGRSLIDALWWKTVGELPPGALCLDIGCGIGAYMSRLIEAGFRPHGIEPSLEMRKLAGERVPAELVVDGSVTDLVADDQSQDFVYAIEVFRYLDAADNALGHQEIFRVLKPGGVFFGTYVNKWALDGYRQYVGLQKARDALTGTVPRYHVEFETPSTVRARLTAAGFADVKIRGAMFAPLRPLHKLSPRMATGLSKLALPRERWLSDGVLSRSFAGHLIAIARRPS